MHKTIKTNAEMPVFLVGIAGNLLLAALKVSISLFGYSKLLFMDGLFSLLCAQIFLFSWGGNELDKKKISEKYPYGLGKALFLVLGIAGLLVMIIAIYMFIYGIQQMGWGEVHKSHTVAMMTALISIIGNELIYRYLKEGSLRINNHIIPLNTFINRIGVAVSFIVIICVTLASLGYSFLERIGVVTISLILFILSLRILFIVFGAIMDRVPSEEILSRVREYTDKVKGVKDVLRVGARQIGTCFHLELMIAVEENLSVGEATKIASQVEDRLLEKIERVQEVHVGFV